MFFYNLKIFLLRLIGYEKPLRVALLKLLTFKFKKFRPHYETILLESCVEAKKLGYDEISVLELGVAGGNGIISLEKYAKNLSKKFNIIINIYGFDYGEGLPETNKHEDIPFRWKSGLYKIDKEKLKKITSNFFWRHQKYNRRICGENPKNITTIYVDLDLYTSTKNFFLQINKLKNYLSPRVFCYFDDLFNPNNYLSEFNGELKAIKEFNNDNKNFKLGSSIDHIADFKFPLAKGQLFTLHNFEHKDYFKYIGDHADQTLSLDNSNIPGNIFKI